MPACHACLPCLPANSQPRGGRGEGGGGEGGRRTPRQDKEPTTLCAGWPVIPDADEILKTCGIQGGVKQQPCVHLKPNRWHRSSCSPPPPTAPSTRR